MRKFKETKKQFDKVREDMELSLVRNAQAPRHRPHEVEEATGALTLTRKCFRHLALDYVLQVSHRASCSEACSGWEAPPVFLQTELAFRAAPLAPENLRCQLSGRNMVMRGAQAEAQQWGWVQATGVGGGLEDLADRGLGSLGTGVRTSVFAHGRNPSPN